LPDARQKIFSILRKADEDGTSVVTHCTGGVGRCGRVAGAWIAHRYNISPQQASDETLACARKHNMNRKCDPDSLEEWLNKE